MLIVFGSLVLLLNMATIPNALLSIMNAARNGSGNLAYVLGGLSMTFILFVFGGLMLFFGVRLIRKKQKLQNKM